MARFTIATGGMVVLLALALVWGGLWAVMALVYVTVATFFLDRITALAAPDNPGAEFPAGDGLAVFLALAQFPLLYGGIARLAGPADPAEAICLFLALALFLGQVGNSNAHELIHRSNRGLRRLGVAVYMSVLYGHHASAHVRVHHVHVATNRDPNSARLGEGFWRFAARAWRGELVEGYRAEAKMRQGRGLHPYAVYAAGAGLSLAIAASIGGAKGVVLLLALSAYAQLQLLLSDYVQHYGLHRNSTGGKPEPVGPRHSWNAPHGFSSALMLNAPRHSDHHAHPGRAYPGLVIDRRAMPILPQPLPVMAVLALLPPVWRRVMDHRAALWADTGAD